MAYRRVQAVGSYGMMNFGDDLFVATVREVSDTLWPGARVRTFVPEESLLFASKTYLGKAFRLGSTLVGLQWADTIALCGGSILQRVNGTARIRQMLLGSRGLEVLGVSVGPFESAGAATSVRRIIERADRLIVRDGESLARVRELSPDMGIRAILGGDLIALNSMVRPRADHSSVITVCPSAAAGAERELLAKQICEGARAVQRRIGHAPTVQLLALSCSPLSDDAALCVELKERLDSYEVVSRVWTYRELGLSACCKMIACSSMVWSQRLHGAIVAYLSEVPFLIVSHHAKCADFGSDIGLDRRVVISEDGRWGPGVNLLLGNGQHIQMPADAYRERARRAYGLVPLAERAE